MSGEDGQVKRSMRGLSTLVVFALTFGLLVALPKATNVAAAADLGAPAGNGDTVGTMAVVTPYRQGDGNFNNSASASVTLKAAALPTVSSITSPPTAVTPQTGDDGMVVVLIAILCVLGGGVFIALSIRRRR